MLEKSEVTGANQSPMLMQSDTCDNLESKPVRRGQHPQTSSVFFKTKMCRFARSGRCKYGQNCRFAHSRDELQESVQASAGAASSSSAPRSSNEANYSGDNQRTVYHVGPLLPEWADVPSDQSTRAETDPSSQTPEGSGDSGQETSARTLQFAMQRRTDANHDERGNRRSRETPAKMRCTTFILTNVPDFLTQGALVSLLEDLMAEMRGAFDFFYCPWDPYENKNLGYAIVNFFERSVAAGFHRSMANQRLLQGYQGMTGLRILPAARQGHAANIQHFSCFSLAHHADPRFRPLLRSLPNEPLRAMVANPALVHSALPDRPPHQPQQLQAQQLKEHTQQQSVPQAQVQHPCLNQQVYSPSQFVLQQVHVARGAVARA
mmetsp:Transcript_14547/g.39945  ORF Transcript_14547/g.39945 Transcript_14547/m.39945 type:complete len:377 (-) Transcript_14547:357-1487(-)